MIYAGFASSTGIRFSTTVCGVRADLVFPLPATTRHSNDGLRSLTMRRLNCCNSSRQAGRAFFLGVAVRETTLKFKRGFFTAVFTAFAIFCVHPFAARYSAISVAAFIGGASAFVRMLLANFVFRE